MPLSIKGWIKRTFTLPASPNLTRNAPARFQPHRELVPLLAVLLLLISCPAVTGHPKQAVRLAGTLEGEIGPAYKAATLNDRPIIGWCAKFKSLSREYNIW